MHDVEAAFADFVEAGFGDAVEAVVLAQAGEILDVDAFHLDTQQIDDVRVPGHGVLKALANETNRQAHYYCVMVLVKYAQDPQPLIAEGIWHGEILTAARGNEGFGYDPIFLDVASGKTGAELNIEVKNKISHRGLALQQLLKKIKLL